MKVIVSVAVSVDGYLDDTSAERLVLSCSDDWAAVKKLRSQCDAILVGANTIRKDNPSLNSGRELIKVTVSTNLDIDPSSRFFTVGDGEKIVFHTCQSVPDELLGMATFIYGKSVTARFIVETLAARGVQTLLVEGGQRVLTMFFAEGVVDELRLAVAPFFVGDSNAPRLTGDGRFPFSCGRRMRLSRVEQVGDMAVMNYILDDDR